MTHRILMWRVGCVTMMRRYGRSCCSMDDRVLILNALEELSSSCRSKMAGYAVKAFSWRFWMHVFENVMADCCVRRGGGEVARLSLVFPELGTFVLEGLACGTS